MSELLDLLELTEDYSAKIKRLDRPADPDYPIHVTVFGPDAMNEYKPGKVWSNSYKTAEDAREGADYIGTVEQNHYDRAVEAGRAVR